MIVGIWLVTLKKINRYIPFILALIGSVMFIVLFKLFDNQSLTYNSVPLSTKGNITHIFYLSAIYGILIAIAIMIYMISIAFDKPFNKKLRVINPVLTIILLINNVFLSTIWWNGNSDNTVNPYFIDDKTGLQFFQGVESI